MRKISTFLIMVILVFNMTGCSSCSPVENQHSNAQTESKVQEESVPEQKLSAADFLKVILQNNAATSEVSARQQLWQAGYSPAEIKDAIDSSFPKSQSEVKKDESSPVNDSEKKDEESKKEESSKNAEESSKAGEESSKTAEESKSQTSESSQSQQSQSSTGSGNQSSSSSSQQSSGGSGSSGQSSQGSSQASSEQSQQSSISASENQTQQQSQQQTQEQSSQSSQTEQPAHTHTWVDVTETVHHDAVTEQVWVVDQPAWDETVEKTEEQEVHKCQCRCGLVFDTSAEWEAHSDQYINASDEEFEAHSGYSGIWVTEEVVVGTETVHHDEVGHYETKTVTEAWDETVVTGQKCSECGAKK